MGLDMYLYKCNDKGEPEQHEFMYWRKANAIHKFFCDNGKVITPAIEYEISRDVLIKLMETCFDILYKNADPALTLPTQSGFFFGSLDYDYYYYLTLHRTLSRLIEFFKNEEEEYIDNHDKMMPKNRKDKQKFYYRASW